MSCNCLKIPDGAEVLARNTTTYRVVYRLGDQAVKVLKERVNRDWVESRARLAAAHADIIEPFSYDVQTHTVRQRYLAELPAATDVARLKGEVARRGLQIGDIQPHNIRSGKLIDFDFVRPVTGPELPRGVHRRGKVVTIRDATPEEIASLGKLVRKPKDHESTKARNREAPTPEPRNLTPLP